MSSNRTTAPQGDDKNERSKRPTANPDPQPTETEHDEDLITISSWDCALVK